MALSSMPYLSLLRYGCALLSVALVVVMRALLHPLLDTQAPLLLFTLAVMVSAWYGGLGPGLLATCLSAFVGGYFFMEPVASIVVADVRDRLVLALFVVVGVMISLLSESLRSSRQRIEDSARELRESEDRYRRIVDTAGEGIWMIDAEARTLFVNRWMAEMLGCSREEIIGKASLDYVYDEDRAEAARKFEDKKRGDKEPFDFRLRRNDGTEIWARISTSSVYGDDGALVGVLGMFTDITARRRAETERDELLTIAQQARAQAEEANRLKDEFLATVSHELRTPLASMLMWTRMLESGNLDQQTTAQAHATLAGNVKLLSQLVEDLLDVSRVVSGKLRIDPRPIRLVPIIEAAIKVVRPAADAKGIEITTKLDPALDDVSGDSSRLQQVFWNLLSNAVKFTPPGGGIEVRLEHVNSYARISVSDTGIGIHQEILPRIFDRFYQVSEQSGERGLGLGLAIVRHLVEMHGGRVEAASPGEGRGATFTVNLPLMIAQSETSNAERERTIIEGATFDCPAALGDVRILVVDDNEDARQITTMVLESCGAQVEQAASCAEAMSLMMEETAPRWEVLVFDIGMPEADGYELMRRVRSLNAEQGGSLPALALTAYAGKEDSQRCFAVGYQAYLAKPVEPGVLVETIARLAGRADKTLSAKNML